MQAAICAHWIQKKTKKGQTLSCVHLVHILGKALSCVHLAHIQTLSCVHLAHIQTLSCVQIHFKKTKKISWTYPVYILYTFLATGTKKSAHPRKHRVCSGWFLVLDFFLTIYNSHAHIELRKRPKGQALFWDN